MMLHCIVTLYQSILVVEYSLSFHQKHCLRTEIRDIRPMDYTTELSINNLIADDVWVRITYLSVVCG